VRVCAVCGCMRVCVCVHRVGVVRASCVRLRVRVRGVLCAVRSCVWCVLCAVRVRGVCCACAWCALCAVRACAWCVVCVVFSFDFQQTSNDFDQTHISKTPSN
jgi:hypothetical protein